MKLQEKKLPEKSLHHDIPHFAVAVLLGFGLLDVKSSQRTGSSPGMNLLLCGATWHIIFFVSNSKSKLTTRLRHVPNFGAQESRLDAFRNLQILQPKIGCPETRCVDIMIFRWVLRLPKFVPGAEHHAELLDMETLHSTARWEVLRWLVVSLIRAENSFLADGVLAHGPGGRPWAAQGGIDLPR